MDKKYGVFVTSAVNATFSKYDPQERLAQTLTTLASVQKHIPNAVICLAESSVPGVDDETKKILSAQVHNMIDLSKDTTINWVHQNITHQDTVKNMSELILTTKFFKVARKQGWFNDCDRIFKISGRYNLNDNFDISKYLDESLKDKFVFKKKMLSQFVYTLTNQSLQHPTRLYSFDTSLLDYYIETLDRMTEHMQEITNENRYIDIEHLVCKFIPNNKKVEFGRLGIEGNIAPHKTFIED
jgi:hypothetical protein